MVGQTRPSINILQDVTVTIQGTSGGDNGVPPSERANAGSPITILVDRVRISDNINVEDHSTAQHLAEWNRLTKNPQTITFETKLQKKANAELLALLYSGNGIIIKFTATAIGYTISGGGIVEIVEPEIANPSLLVFNVRQYGELFSTSAA